MKNYFLIITLAIPAWLFAQNKGTLVSDLPPFEFDEETNLVTYTDVVNVEGVNKDNLYDLASDWIRKYYKNSTTVMQVQNKTDGILEGRHSFYVMREVNGLQTKGDLIKYSFKIQCRDGRYKYTITKINVQKAAYYGIENWINDEEKAGDYEIQLYLEQIHAFFTEDFI
ncbi:MAG: DUF4468 domain-containing protein, partial [Chitinophagales bacterium]